MAKSIIPIEIIELEEESFHLFIEVGFGKHKTGNLIIDTGASKTVFDKSFVKEWIIDHQIRKENITSSGINNAIDDIEFVILESIRFKELIIENFATATMDLSHINAIYENFGNRHIAGLIGSDFLLKYNATISYKAKHLIIEY